MAFSVDSVPYEIAPFPTKIFSAREICEASLRLIGAYTPADLGADPANMEAALLFMEMQAATLSGTEECQWLRPQTVEITLDADTPAYDLSDQAGANEPSLYIMYPISAMLEDDAGNETPIEIIRRNAYEAHTDKDTVGTPCEIYIDRTNDQQALYVYPVPNVDTYTLRIYVQTYARSVLGNLGDVEAGNVPHGFDRTWQLWLAYATAMVIGDGPVRQLSDRKVERLAKIAGGLQIRLQAWQNREKIKRKSPVTKRYDY